MGVGNFIERMSTILFVCGELVFLGKGDVFPFLIPSHIKDIQ